MMKMTMMVVGAAAYPRRCQTSLSPTGLYCTFAWLDPPNPLVFEGLLPPTHNPLPMVRNVRKHTIEQEILPLLPPPSLPPSFHPRRPNSNNSWCIFSLESNLHHPFLQRHWETGERMVSSDSAGPWKAESMQSLKSTSSLSKLPARMASSKVSGYAKAM